MENISKFKGQALNYNVFVKKVQIENVTEAGIHITSETDKNEKYRKGIVVSVGNMCPNKEVKTILRKFFSFLLPKEPIVAIGDEVLYDSYKSSELTIDGEAFEVIYFADLVCIK